MGRQTDVSLPDIRRDEAMARFAVLRPHLEDDVPLVRHGTRECLSVPRGAGSRAFIWTAWRGLVGPSGTTGIGADYLQNSSEWWRAWPWHDPRLRPPRSTVA